MSISLQAATAFFAAAGLCAPATAVAHTPTQQALQQCIDAEAQQRGFSGVVSITRPDFEVVVAKGLMGTVGSAAMLPNAQFNVGSAGKMWTAVAIAQLVDAQKVDLDANVARYVSGLTAESGAVTVRQLLTHSGGLGNFFVPENWPVIERAKQLRDLRALVTSAKPAFPPGSKVQYSNSGFLLLGLLIEEVSGLPYAEYLKRYVFAPAGMVDSSLLAGDPSIRAMGLTRLPEIDPHAPPPGPGAAGPRPGQPGPMQGPPPGPLRVASEAQSMGNPAGGGYSTPADMTRFFAALWAGKLTSPAMLKALTSRQVTLLPEKGDLPEVFYGLGFSGSTHFGRAWVGHNGGLPGANVVTLTVPEDQVTVVVMSNRDPPAADWMMDKVRALMLDGKSCRA